MWEIGRLNGNSRERVGHPTQKPVELITRFVKALSFKGSVVLDFFAGSGTTGRVCVEQQRHSLLVDSDNQLVTYLDKHLRQITLPSDYTLMINKPINMVLEEIQNIDLVK